MKHLDLKNKHFFSRGQFTAAVYQGYKLSIEEIEAKELPNFKVDLSNFLLSLRVHFKNFPNCCDVHKEHQLNNYFKLEEFLDVPEKIINQISSTKNHIINMINEEDWFLDITDFIEYNIYTFGHPAVGLGYYIEYIQYLLNETSWLIHYNIPIEKASAIHEYIENFQSNNNSGLSNSEFHNLITIYKDWLNIFPFELSLFKDLLPKISFIFPVIKKSDIHKNKYLGSSKIKFHTKESFIEFLSEITNKILNTFNCLEEYSSWQPNDTEKKKLELILAERRIKSKIGYLNNSTSDTILFS